MAGNSGGKAPRFKPPNRNERTLPPWMDAEDKHGQVVVVSIRPASEEGKLPNNPFVVAKTVQTAIGKVSDAYRVKNKEEVIVKVRSTSDADKLKAIKELFDGTKVCITSPEKLNSSKGVVSCERTAQLSDQEIKDELKDQGVIDVKRFTKNGPNGRFNTDTMTLTFAGLSLPTEVFFGFEKCRVREFRPNPMLCFKCAEYGHVTKYCQKKEACKTCSEPHQLKDEEGNPIKCPKKLFCKNCQGHHSPMDKKCPKYAEETAIIDVKHEQKVSYAEARRIIKEQTKANNGTTYASVGRNGLSTSAQSRLTAAAAEESTVVAALRAEITKMKTTINNMKKDNSNEAELKKDLRTANRVIEALQSEVKELRLMINTTETAMDEDTEEIRKRQRESSGSNDSNQSTLKKANNDDNSNNSEDEGVNPITSVDESTTESIHISYEGEVTTKPTNPNKINQDKPNKPTKPANTVQQFLKDKPKSDRSRSKEPKGKKALKNKH